MHFEFPSTVEIIDQAQAIVVEFPEQLTEFTFLNAPLSNEINGHAILIQFVNVAREQMGITEFDRIMGSSWDQSIWEERLIGYMNKGHWTEQDAGNFVLFLIGRIGLENTLKRIKNNVSYFSSIIYLDFIDKISFYDEFLGEDIVNILLSNSLGGFTKENSLSELRDIISFIHKYIEDEEELRAFVKKQIINIAKAIYSDLIEIEELLIEYHFTKNEIKTLMQKSFTGFATAKPENLRAVADFLINGKIKINGSSQVVLGWEGENFTKAEVKILMQKSFDNFTRAKPESLHAVANFLINEYNFTKAEVKTLMKNSFFNFATANPENLRVVANFLINEYSFTKTEVKTLMQKSFTGFATANIKILKGITESGINVYMQKEDIKMQIQHNIQAFLDINFNTLTTLLKSLQQIINSLSITQKQKWEIRLKQILLEHLLKEDLIEKLQKLEKEITSSRTKNLCQEAVSDS